MIQPIKENQSGPIPDKDYISSQFSAVLPSLFQTTLDEAIRQLKQNISQPKEHQAPD